MPKSPQDVYFAFADGGLAYDCAPCQQCCRGFGLIMEREDLAAHPGLSRLSPFVRLGGYRDGSQSLLTTLYNYTHACTELLPTGGCAIHQAQGAKAKPTFCQLFPFSKMVEVEGLWVLLPHPRCPWQAAPATTQSADSRHEDIAALLTPDLLQGVSPNSVRPLTSLAPDKRRRLEEKVRADTTLASSLEDAFEAQRQAHLDLGHGANKSPDRDLWLDLLRSAGEPAPLEDIAQATFKAALPALRIHCLGFLHLADLCQGLEAFALYLQTLSELAPQGSPAQILHGENLLSHLEFARPWVWLLANAEKPAQACVPSDALLPQEVAEILREDGARPLGECILQAFAEVRHGALPAIRSLAEPWCYRRQA